MSDIGGMRLNTPESRWRADRSSDLIIYLSAGGRLTRRSRREGTRGAFRRNGTVPPLLVTPMFVPGTRRIPDRTKSGAAPFSSSSGAVGGLMLPNWLLGHGRRAWPPRQGAGGCRSSWPEHWYHTGREGDQRAQFWARGGNASRWFYRPGSLNSRTQRRHIAERKHSAVKIASDCFSLSNSNTSRMRLIPARNFFVFESPHYVTAPALK